MQILDSVEVRVLSSLVEKEATTPEYYPLSLNALVAACNQKSSRDPVVDYDEDTVRVAIEGLRAKQLLYIIEGGRVSKYRQRISETLNLGRRELAVLCVLMLRGWQTLGEIKERSDRLFSFADMGEAERVLDRLAEWPDGALAIKLPRQAGQKDARYAHLLEGQPPTPSMSPISESPAAPTRLAQLEAEVQDLRSEVEALKSRMDHFETLLR